jgi:hypothetical protein
VNNLPGDWYIYRSGTLVASRQTRESAVAWAREQIRQWRQQGAPRIPEYKVHFNREWCEPEIVQ